MLLASRIPDSVGKDIEKACQSIYPLHDVYVRKVKMLKKPKFECKWWYFTVNQIDHYLEQIATYTYLWAHMMTNVLSPVWSHDYCLLRSTGNSLTEGII